VRPIIAADGGVFNAPAISQNVVAEGSVGTIGTGEIHTFENDTGPDDANHAQDGLAIVTGPGIAHRGPVAGMQLMDITPTVLRLFGLQIPPDLQGHALEGAHAREPAPA